ncbi:MAG: ACP S-malonyltransferase [Gammaproteobacteria bacterium]
MKSNLAFVFPGQGSQFVGMLSELAGNESIIENTFAQASEVLGYDLWSIVKNGPEEKLNQTEITQPALLVASYALYHLWLEKGGEEPELMAGHSLGEYSALVCSGAIDFPAGVDLVSKRGQYMQEAMQGKKGSMAAIVGLEDKQVTEICEEAAKGEVLSAANYNSIGQVVIAGEKSAVERAIILAEKMNARLAKEIPVSVPCHCSFMTPAAEKLANTLANIEIKAPKIPVIHNVDLESYSDPNKIRKALVLQIDHPVRWVETIQLMAQKGITGIVECGPGKVLSGLIKRIDKNISINSIEF